MTAYSYYPGCSLEGTAKEYDRSTRLVCQALGIELKEMEDWVCCGASSAHTTSPLLGLALPAHELQHAEELGRPLAVACAMCFSRLKFAAHDLADETKLDLVKRALGKDFSNKATVVHLLQILDIEEKLPITRPLQGLKVACYYGCLLVRPPDVMRFDDKENPQIMDRLLQRVGAQTLDWGLKTDCCGASLPFARPDMVDRMSYRLLAQAREAGADCVAVACPMCHANLDTRQGEMKARYDQTWKMPVLYFTQLVGIALGLTSAQLMLNRHFIDPVPMLKGKGLA